MPDVTTGGDPDERASAIGFRVVGHVQGVFFRASTRDHAQRRGVTGWVRNEPDGSVRGWLEGRPDDVRAVLDWVRGGGPRGATVDDLRVEEVAPEGHRSFTIRH